MRGTFLQINSNTDKQFRYSSGMCEFHLAGILLNEQDFDLKGN